VVVRPHRAVVLVSGFESEIMVKIVVLKVKIVGLNIKPCGSSIHKHVTRLSERAARDLMVKFVILNIKMVKIVVSN